MNGVFDIIDFGAVGDGATLNTQAIQQAINAAGEQQGGTVAVPAGVFVTGTIFLRSGVTLSIHPAGTLLGSPRLDDYIDIGGGRGDRRPWHLVVAEDASDITITGGGTIDGNGPAFWEPCTSTPGDPPLPVEQLDPINCVPAREKDPAKAPLTWIRHNRNARPSPMIEIINCREVRIRELTIRNSAGWNLSLHDCQYVWVTGVKVEANLMGPNNDGIDITGCHDVMISDCCLSCCDDAICLKTWAHSNTCERITVTNCVIRTRCAALKLGSTESFRDMRDITFSNCVVYESHRAVGLYCVNGGTLENIAISNITCDTCQPFVLARPVHLDLRRYNDDAKLGRIRNVSISNFIANTDGRIVLTAEAGGMLENIVLRDVQMHYPTVEDPDPIGRDTGGEQFSNRSPQARVARGVVVVENAHNLVVDNLQVTWPATAGDGRVATPDRWRFGIKAANGSTDFFEWSQFNRDAIPPFHVVWARNVQGGYLRAPLASPAGAAERFALIDSDIEAS
jgi:polygalacturonase